MDLGFFRRDGMYIYDSFILFIVTDHKGSNIDALLWTIIFYIVSSYFDC